MHALTHADCIVTAKLCLTKAIYNVKKIELLTQKSRQNNQIDKYMYISNIMNMG